MSEDFKYVIIDGQDKTGKTTISKRLQKKYGLKIARFPSAKNKALFQEILDGTINSQLVALHMFSADILAEMEKMKRKGGKYVFDRSFISTLAYQSGYIAEKYFDGNIHSAIDYIFRGFFPNYKIDPEPSFIFILTVNSLEYQKRLEEYHKKMGTPIEVYEKVEFQRTLFDKFVKIYRYLTFWYSDSKIMFIDTSDKSIDTVYEIIENTLKEEKFI